MNEALDALRDFLLKVGRTEERELDCEQVFRVLDLYTEAVVEGEAGEELLPLVEQHLEMCHDCQEEYEALLRILEARSV
jgi:predicted anti-sigma-YlaC factor YlaD